jgi:hypothetical protein
LVTSIQITFSSAFDSGNRLRLKHFGLSGDKEKDYTMNGQRAMSGFQVHSRDCGEI